MRQSTVPVDASPPLPVRVLTAEEMVCVWERSQGEPAWRGALHLIAACSAAPEDNLLRLPLGQRNVALARAREALFGDRIDAFGECPNCGARLEFTVDVAALTDPQEPLADAVDLKLGDLTVRVRSATSEDLALASGCRSEVEGRALLLTRCVLQASRHGAPVAIESLPEATVAQIIDHLEQLDPAAEIWLALDCPSCGDHWEPQLDLPSFVWAELSTEAKRLLREVSTLASVYGWREAEILALTPTRRQHYLEMAG